MKYNEVYNELQGVCNIAIEITELDLIGINMKNNYKDELKEKLASKKVSEKLAAFASLIEMIEKKETFIKN